MSPQKNAGRCSTIDESHDKLLECRPVKSLELIHRHEVVGLPRIGHENPDVAEFIRLRKRSCQRFLQQEFTHRDEFVRLSIHVQHRALHAANAVGDHIKRRHCRPLKQLGNAVVKQHLVELVDFVLAPSEFPPRLLEIFDHGFKLGLGKDHRQRLRGPRLDPTHAVQLRKDRQPFQAFIRPRQMTPYHEIGRLV
jgi:hypothetical protein